MLLKLKTVLFGRAELHQVVIQALFADLDSLSSVFERKLNKLALVVAATVEQPPLADLGNHFLDGAFLDARLASVVLLVTSLERFQVLQNDTTYKYLDKVLVRKLVEFINILSIKNAPSLMSLFEKNSNLSLTSFESAAYMFKF